MAPEDGTTSGALAAEIRRRIGPAPAGRDLPLVSIVVPSRDGAALLRRMVSGLVGATDYPHLELIVVDNGSSDESLELIRRVEAPFPISILSNPHNESFSDACNKGVEIASGELLLFLNNDTQPFEPGWLAELVTCLIASKAGAVSSTLICREEEHRVSFRHGYGVQHRGLAFREEGGMIHPVLHGWEADPLDERLGQDDERGAVAAACVLVGREAYEQVGGFTHGYVYGAEDIDLCLKLRRAGLRVLCSGRSVVIHHPVSTRRAAPFEEEQARKLANRHVLWERWGPQLRREYELDRLRGGGIWLADGSAVGGEEKDRAGAGRPSRAEVEAPGFCLKAADPTSLHDLEAVAATRRRGGHRCLVLPGERAEDPLGLNYDIAVDVRGHIRYVLPRPGQLSVLWIVSDSGTVTDIERSPYDIVLTGRDDLDRFADHLLSAIDDRFEKAGFGLRVDSMVT